MFWLRSSRSPLGPPPRPPRSPPRCPVGDRNGHCLYMQPLRKAVAMPCGREGRWGTHRAKAVSEDGENTQGKGGVLAAKDGGNTGQRRCLGREGQWKHRSKAKGGGNTGQRRCLIAAKGSGNTGQSRRAVETQGKGGVFRCLSVSLGPPRSVRRPSHPASPRRRCPSRTTYGQ